MESYACFSQVPYSYGAQIKQLGRGAAVSFWVITQAFLVSSPVTDISLQFSSKVCFSPEIYSMLFFFKVLHLLLDALKLWNHLEGFSLL